MEKHDHSEILDRVSASMPDAVLLDDLADFFSIWGNPTRLRILYALSVSEMCVCAISELFSLEQSAVSHQLSILRKANLIKGERRGKTVFYSLADDHVKTIISTGYEHLTEKD